MTQIPLLTQAAAAGAYAPLPHVAATVSADGAAVVNKHNPVDATGAARTITLPTGQTEGTALSVEKVDSSTNTVTLSGSIRGAGSTTIALAWFHETLTLVADSTGSWWPVSGHKTKTALDAAYAGKATTSTGGVASTGDGFPVIFQTPGGGNWHLDTQTASDSSTDHLFRRVYNYDMVNAATNKRRVDDVAIREAFESNYLGAFEWDLDLTAASGDLNLSAPFRPWYYTYQWASGASRLAFSGQMYIKSNRDEIAANVVATSDSQVAPTFQVSKADGSTGLLQVSAQGSVITAPATNKKALVVVGLASASVAPFQVQVNSVVFSEVQAAGLLVGYKGMYAVPASTSGIGMTVAAPSGQSGDLFQGQVNGSRVFSILASGQRKPVAANEATGAGSAALGANCPAVTATAPYTWEKITTSDGSQGYIPVWK